MATIVFQFRVEEKELDRFKQRCDQYKLDHRDVFRELVSAYADQRLTIQPAAEQLKLLEEVYDVPGIRTEKTD